MANILVVDDDDLTRSLLMMVLEKQGHMVKVARDGKNALQLALENCFDLIFTDIFMPEMDGMELIAEVRRSCPAMKIVAISGGSAGMKQDYLKIARKLGASRVFSKPLEMEKVVDVVSEILAETA